MGRHSIPHQNQQNQVDSGDDKTATKAGVH
jgi:hypothetical protein